MREPTLQNWFLRSRALRRAGLPLPLVLGLLSACKEDTDNNELTDAAHDSAQQTDAGVSDAAPEEDGEASALDASPPLDATSATGDAELAGDASADAAGPRPLGPYELDCANLPSNGTCQGGPREVLLVTEDRGLVAMFDPTDGHFLGYLKRPGADYYKEGVEDLWQATQGPDQCIWTVSEDEDAEIQRWNTDGSYRDAPLVAHTFPLSSGQTDEAVQDPVAIAFSADRLFVASQYGDPHPRVTRWKLDGTFDGVVLDDGSDVRSLLPLNDGTLLVSDYNQSRIARMAEGSQQASPVLGGLTLPGQIWYAGEGKLLVSDNSSGTPVREVDIATGMARVIAPDVDYLTNKYGIAALKNGKWLITGGSFLVSTLDPESSNPPGQITQVWDDNAVDSVTFYNIGRACLPEALVNSRAPKPAQDTCIDAPPGPALLEENFEGSAAFEGTGSARHYKSFYNHGTAGVTSSIDETGGNQGSRALRIAGAGTIPLPGGRTRTHKTGVFVSLASAQPKYVLPVKAGSEYTYWVGYFALQNAAANTDQYERLAGTYFNAGYLRSLESNASSYPDAFDARWLLIELRNIDWTARTYDLYVDCKRLAEAVAMPAGLGDSVDLLDLYNVATTPSAQTVSWFDDILIK